MCLFKFKTEIPWLFLTTLRFVFVKAEFFHVNLYPASWGYIFAAWAGVRNFSHASSYPKNVASARRVVNLHFEKEKLRGNVVFTTTATRSNFALLTLICKFPFIWRISLETKMSPLISQMLVFVGTLFILTIKIFEAWLQTFHSNVSMWECCEKCCNWIHSHNTLQDRITWSFSYFMFFYCLQNIQDVSPVST